MRPQASARSARPAVRLPGRQEIGRVGAARADPGTGQVNAFMTKPRAGRTILLGYLIALIASWVWVGHLSPGSPVEERSDPGLDSAEGDSEEADPAAVPTRRARLRVVDPAVGADPVGAGDRRIDLAYRIFDPDRAEASGEPVVLLHGSPGSLQNFGALATRLAGDRPIIVPDMVGFGASTRRAPDYSFESQAAYLVQLLDTLGLQRAHFVGFSWGGAVAIALGERWPERVASIALVSAIGVQELELLGRYDLNHLVHVFQHAFFRAVDWLVPHFGLLGPSPLAVGFTRSFLDSDQRPLRAALEAWDGPMLIVHGNDDSLVPPAAAREHHRLVPQSRLVWIEGGHLVLWTDADQVTETIARWLDDFDRGRLPRRADASAERRRAAAAPFDRGQAGPQDGLGWLVFVALVFAASMVSEDLTCAGVGLLVAMGQVGFVGGVAACLLALVAGDLVLYLAGRLIGARLLERFGRDGREVGRIEARLRRSGAAVVLLGRFVPGARLPTYVAAGVIRYPLLPFTLYLTLAAALWAPLLVGLTALGGRALDMQDPSSRTGLWLALALIGLIALAARLLPRLASHRGRRLLQSRWRRLRRWEFWPVWAIYLPLVPSILASAWRHRSLRVVTLVNPAIEGGGLAGESKAAIQKALDVAPAHAIPTCVVSGGAAEPGLARVRGFMQAYALDYPIVLKPDVGERGRGVRIASDDAEVRAYLERAAGPILAQEYVGGEEFGLFYLRRPGERQGEIFSLARKTPRFVVGNGRDPLERLILDDPTCLPMAERLLAANAEALESIPAAGEWRPVSTLGTHSLGCRFLEGRDLWSKALEEAIDALSRRAELDFGRFDVRAPSEQALGEGVFRVIEFNGLTAEAAHVYDPANDLRAALRILREQWRQAFEIGAAHRAAGRRPLSWRALLSLIRASRA